jgi:hypothetical protein
MLYIDTMEILVMIAEKEKVKITYPLFFSFVCRRQTPLLIAAIKTTTNRSI